MMAKSCSIDELADVINEGLQEYATLTATGVKKAVRKNGEGTDFRQCAGEVRTVCQKLGGEDHGGEQPEVSADGVFPDKIYAGAPAGKRPRQAERRPCGW